MKGKRSGRSLKPHKLPTTKRRKAGGAGGEAWWYEDERGIDVYQHATPGTITSARIPWRRLILAAERCGYKFKVGPPVAIEFLRDVEALLDWMNGNDLSADHQDQRPDEYARLCRSLTAMQEALGLLDSGSEPGAGSRGEESKEGR